MQILLLERQLNLALSLIALVLVLVRARAAVQDFGRKRIARYFAYVGFIFWAFEGNLESIVTGAPTGVKTVVGTAILLYAIYSEMPDRSSPESRIE